MLNDPRSLFGRFARSTSRRATFARFAGVGSTIALIDVGVLYLLLWLLEDAPGVNVYTARVVSYTCAMTAGYLLNRYFTFHHLERVRVLWHELLRFFSVHALGGVLNFAVFSLVVIVGERAGLTGLAGGLVPLFGVWIGGLAGMCFNFRMARKHVFGS